MSGRLLSSFYRSVTNIFALHVSSVLIGFLGCNCAETHGACSTFKCVCISRNFFRKKKANTFQPCRALNFECDPDLCKSCGAVENCSPRHRHKKLEAGSCQNVALQRAATPALSVGESVFEGWNYGLYALEDIKAGSFLGEYVGEILTEEESERRGIVYEEYFFNLNAEQSIDATRMGSYMRFVNGKLR